MHDTKLAENQKNKSIFKGKYNVESTFDFLVIGMAKLLESN